MDIEAMGYAAIEVTETTGVDAGNAFVWCAGCAENLVRVDDDHVAICDWADYHETVEDAAMPAVLVSGEELPGCSRCACAGCSGVWSAGYWFYRDDPGWDDLQRVLGSRIRREDPGQSG